MSMTCKWMFVRKTSNNIANGMNELHLQNAKCHMQRSQCEWLLQDHSRRCDFSTCASHNVYKLHAFDCYLDFCWRDNVCHNMRRRSAPGAWWLAGWKAAQCAMPIKRIAWEAPLNVPTNRSAVAFVFKRTLACTVRPRSLTYGKGARGCSSCLHIIASLSFRTVVKLYKYSR